MTEIVTAENLDYIIKEDQKKEKKLSLHAGLNHGPLDFIEIYKSSALPLSYRGRCDE